MLRVNILYIENYAYEKRQWRLKRPIGKCQISNGPNKDVITNQKGWIAKLGNGTNYEVVAGSDGACPPLAPQGASQCLQCM